MTWDHKPARAARIRLKVSDSALGEALRFLGDCRAGHLPMDSGTQRVLERPGLTLIAVRLDCGGIDMRETRA